MSDVVVGKHAEYKLYKNKKLGKGGFATVFKGINIRTNEEVAIKHITKREDYGVREAKKMEELSKDKDNIFTVKLLDYTESSKGLFLILPYYEHGSLRDYIEKNGKLPLEMIKSVFKQIVRCLAYLHKDKQIMHRDLTAANVIIKRITNDDIKVCLGDFGLAKDFKHGPQKHQTICGTPGFMPPEFNDKKYGMENEIYSLGGILYYMFTTSSPKPNQEDRQIEKIRNEIRNDDVTDLIKKLWHKNPSNRPSLSEIEKHSFLNKCRSRREERSSSNTRKRTPSSGRKQTVDSAYESNKKTGTRTRGASTERKAAASEKRTRTSKERRTDSTERRNDFVERKNEKTNIQWPIPPFYMCKPGFKKQLDETRIMKNGRIMIMDSDLLVYEVVPKNSKYVEYIFEVKLKNDKQEVIVYEPENRKTTLPKIGDDIIIEKNFVKRISKPNDLDQNYIVYYNFIVKAIKIFYKRNAKINYSYVNGIKNFTAKLMYDDSFRFIFDKNIYFQESNTSEIKSADENQISKMTEKERKIFTETRKELLVLDEIRTKHHGKYYERLNFHQKNI